MTLTTECEKGHIAFTWSCKYCEEKLRIKIIMMKLAVI